MPTPDERLAALGLALPVAQPPVATYVPFVALNGLVFVSGQLPMRDGMPIAVGKLGRDVSLELGTEAARQCFLNVLAHLRVAAGGDLSRVTRVVRLGGFIACTAEFSAHPAVMNGASDLAVDLWGESGRHARTTVGVPSLPLDAAVEVDGIFALA